MQFHRLALCAGMLALSACAGDGEGLDANGRPAEEQDDSEVLTPQFESIQANVFTPICTACHTGAAAPLGLRLDEGVSFALLVNAASSEVPALLRVEPGNPDASYLIQKLEGTAAVGARMPLGGAPLPAETIAVIRQWILEGAQPPLAATNNAAPSKLVAAWPVQGAKVQGTPSIVIAAQGELDASLLQAGTISIRRFGGDSAFASGNDGAMNTNIEADIKVRSLSPTVIEVRVQDEQWTPGSYELRLSGTGPLALADLAAQPIDGDEDGRAGGDFVLSFTVEEGR